MWQRFTLNLLAVLYVVATMLAHGAGHADAQHCRIYAGGSSQSSATAVGTRNGELYILASAHGVARSPVSIELFDDSGNSLRRFLDVTIDVKDPSRGVDLAILKVPAVDGLPTLPISSAGASFAGKGKLFGFPNGQWRMTPCSMDLTTGNLSVKVLGGNSGGAFVDDATGTLIGVLVRYHGCTTLQTIHNFLTENDRSWLFEPKTVVVQSPSPPPEKEKFSATSRMAPRNAEERLIRDTYIFRQTMERTMELSPRLTDDQRNELIQYLLGELARGWLGGSNDD